MGRLVTMHQPNYLPWIGLFSKISQADCFIVADTSRYSHQTVINRNRIRTKQGSILLTVPVERKYHLSRICDVMLPPDRTWADNHWKTIYNSYLKTKFFRQYQDFFKTLYQENYEHLAEVNISILRYLIKCFDLNVEMISTRDLDLAPDLKGTDFIIAALKSVGAEAYLSGPSGNKYLEVEKFPRNYIELKFSRFQHPVYPQRFPDFEPNMAAIDLLFNIGPRASEIIRASGGIEQSQDMELSASS